MCKITSLLSSFCKCQKNCFNLGHLFQILLSISCALSLCMAIFRWCWGIFWFWCVGLILWIDCGALIRHIRNIPIVVVSSILDSLYPPIRKVHSVCSCHHLGIRVLAGTKVSAGVIILYCVLVVVWLGSLLLIGWWGTIGRRTISTHC